jgi:hypothetical protein
MPHTVNSNLNKQFLRISFVLATSPAQFRRAIHSRLFEKKLDWKIEETSANYLGALRRLTEHELA